MSNDKMVSLEEIRVGLTKAKEAIKKQLGLMKSSVGQLSGDNGMRKEFGCSWN